MTERRVERRKTQRVDATLKLEVQIPRDDGELQAASLETLNISSSGIYFRSDRFLEPMTKLEMVLELPISAGTDQSGPEIAAVPCEGIVVRVTPEEEQEGCDHYEIAVFFTGIDEEGILHLEQHVALLLTAV
jgi:hypothetical protein